MSTEVQPTRRKCGAPKGNRNRLRHGLTTGQLPTGCGWVATLTNQLRSALEREVIAQHGEVSLYHAALVNTAIRWERHALLAQRWLRVAALTVEQQLAFHREVARASTERDKCLRELQLHTTDSQAIIRALYSSPPNLPDVPAVSPTPAATDTQTAAHASTDSTSKDAPSHDDHTDNTRP